MANPFRYEKLESRWAARRAAGVIGGPNGEGLELRRVPTLAERVISAPRTVVWAVLVDEDDETDIGFHQQIVGAPASGVGARHVSVGPPSPPFGMRTVMYNEVTAVQEGYWITSQMLAGSWEHIETFFLLDAADGQTLARITGWWTKPAPRTADFSSLQATLNGLAAKALDRVARRAEKIRPA